MEITSIIKRNSCGKALDIARMARDMRAATASATSSAWRATWRTWRWNTYEGGEARFRVCPAIVFRRDAALPSSVVSLGGSS